MPSSVVDGLISGIDSSVASPASSEAFGPTPSVIDVDPSGVHDVDPSGVRGLENGVEIPEDDAMNWYEDAVRYATSGAFTPVEDFLPFGAGANSCNNENPAVEFTAAAAAAAAASCDGSTASVALDTAQTLNQSFFDNFSLTG